MFDVLASCSVFTDVKPIVSEESVVAGFETDPLAVVEEVV